MSLEWTISGKLIPHIPLGLLVTLNWLTGGRISYRIPPAEPEDDDQVGYEVCWVEEDGTVRKWLVPERAMPWFQENNEALDRIWWGVLGADSDQAQYWATVEEYDEG